MKFRCKKNLWCESLILFPCCAFVCGGIFINEALQLHSFWGVCFGLWFFVYIFWRGIAYAIYSGKTIELSPDGCLITIWFFKKFYPWVHYETKLFQKVKKANRYGSFEGDWVIVFAPRFREEYKSPLFYLLNHAPISGFCLGFYSKNHNDDVKMFEANADTAEILKQWGVKIRNYRPEIISNL